jgi:SAM-dependent methyltransferase
VNAGPIWQSWVSHRRGDRDALHRLQLRGCVAEKATAQRRQPSLHASTGKAMTVDTADNDPPVPINAEIAAARVRGMRGKRGIVGDQLHALGVRLGIFYGGSFYYPSEDRSILECMIIPNYPLSRTHGAIVFVGTDWYTQGYARMFSRKAYTTIDPDPDRVRYGADRHIIDVVGNLERHMAPGSVDAIFLNGVVGWGLNTIEDAERAFAACHACLREGGHFLIGWNDLPEHRPFRLAEVPSLRKFQPLVFPPLEANEYLIDNEWRHTYSFFYK